MKLTLGRDTQSIDINLFEVTAAIRKTELQAVIFRMADCISGLEASAEKDQQTISKLRQQQGTSKDSGVSGMVDFGNDNKRGKGLQKPISKQPGMSIVNPGCRKRKIAKGVEFD